MLSTKGWTTMDGAGAALISVHHATMLDLAFVIIASMDLD